MIETIIEFSRYFVALLFGTVVATRFVGLQYTKKNYTVLSCFIILTFLLQVGCLWLYGMEKTLKIYPLISHVPIILFIVIYLKRSWLISLTSMLVTFLCCQPLRWVGTLLNEIFDSVSMNHIGYNITAFFMYILIEKYALKSVQHMMSRSVLSCLLLAAMPTFYYVFEYATIVYTDFMYSGERIAVQFLPFITCAFYLIFVLLYYEETKKQLQTQRELDMLDTQFKQAQNEFLSLKQLQQQAATYRHDMRHHFSLLQSFASEGNMDDIKKYLHIVQSDLDTITPVRFCENETVNLILSSFSTKAKLSRILFSVEAKLPENLPFSDTELCSLLSNALENALHACKKITNSNERIIKVRMYSKNNKLCIDIRNSYELEPLFYQGIPVSEVQGHGFGAKSMAHIVEKHSGVYRFSVKDHWFLFQATI